MLDVCPNLWRPDPHDQRVPIGPPDTTVSMQGHGASATIPAQPIKEQPLEYPFDVGICWGIERFISQIEGLVDQFRADVIRSHGSSLSAVLHVRNL